MNVVKIGPFLVYANSAIKRMEIVLELICAYVHFLWEKERN